MLAGKFDKTKLRRALVLTLLWLAVFWVIVPSLANRYLGQSSLLRFDPTVSSDYNCIFIEGHSRDSFAVPWTMHSTAVEYLRIRYTPLAKRQHYGIMFVDSKTLAFEAHIGFAKSPSRLSRRLDSPNIVRDWMRSQPWSAQAASHDRDAREIYDAIVALAPADLEHFVLPAGTALSHFTIGHTAGPNRDTPSWNLLLILIPLWLGVFVRRREKKQSNDGRPAIVLPVV